MSSIIREPRSEEETGETEYYQCLSEGELAATVVLSVLGFVLLCAVLPTQQTQEGARQI